MMIKPLRRQLPAKTLLAGMVCITTLLACSGDDTVKSDRVAAGRDDQLIAAGRDKSIRCLACHGAEGMSDYDVWPNLAGQTAEYLARQLRDFRSGRRHDPWMSPMARPLSDQDIDEIAAYFSSVSGVTGGPGSVPPLAATCVACHSASAVETNPLRPFLVGQNRRYLVKQLKDFREGRRTDPVMAPMASALSNQNIEALAVFYASP